MIIIVLILNDKATLVNYKQKYWINSINSFGRKTKITYFIKVCGYYHDQVKS